MADSLFTSSWLDAPARNATPAAGAKRSAEVAGLGDRSFLDLGARNSRSTSCSISSRPEAAAVQSGPDDLTQEERETRLGALVGALSDRQCRRLVLAHAMGHGPLMEDIEDALEAWGEDDEDEEDEHDSPDREQPPQKSSQPRPRRPSRPGFPSQDPRHSPTTPRRKANRRLYTDREVLVSRETALTDQPAQHFELYVERLELKIYAYSHRPNQNNVHGEKKRAAIDYHWAREIIDLCNANLRSMRESISNDAVSPKTLINACQAVVEMTLLLLGAPDNVRGLIQRKYSHSKSDWVHHWPDLSFEEYFALLNSEERDIFLAKVLWRTGKTINQELSDIVQRCNEESLLPGFGDAVGTLLPVPLEERPGATQGPREETGAATFRDMVDKISRDHDRECKVRGDRAPLIHAFPVAFRISQAIKRIAFDIGTGSSFETRNNALVALCDLTSIVLRDPLTRFGDEIRRHFLTEGDKLVETFKGIVDGLSATEKAAVLDQAYVSLRGTVEEPTVEDALEEYVQDAKFHGLFQGLDECLRIIRSKNGSSTEKRRASKKARTRGGQSTRH